VPRKRVGISPRYPPDPYSYARIRVAGGSPSKPEFAVPPRHGTPIGNTSREGFLGCSSIEAVAELQGLQIQTKPK